MEESPRGQQQGSRDRGGAEDLYEEYRRRTGSGNRAMPRCREEPGEGWRGWGVGTVSEKNPGTRQRIIKGQGD